MEFWPNLGIEKTRDSDAIIAAYHEKLRLFHPEDKPEEFKALRAEYDEAMRYAHEQESAEKSEGEQSPVEQWTSRLKEIYTHIDRRCDARQWQELLRDPLCEGLDSRIEVRDAMLKYLMDHWHLPQPIWQMLDEAFALQQNAGELCETFPRDFINDAVISGIHNPSFMPYEKFLRQNQGDVDPYFTWFYKARDAIYEKNFETVDAILSDIERSGIVHPYTELLRLRLAFARAELQADDELAAKAEALYRSDPDDSQFAELYGDALMSRGEYAAAKEIYAALAEKMPDANSIRYHQAKCCMQLGEYAEAKEILADLQDKYPYDEAIRDRLKEANDKVTEEYARLVQQEPENTEARLEYAWCLFQQDEEEKAREVLDFPPPADLAQRCDYENILTKLNNNLGDYDASMAHAKEWLAAVELLPEGETPEEKRRKNKVGEIRLLESMAFLARGSFEEAVQKTTESLAADPQEYRAYTIRRDAYMMLHDYDNALKACEELVQVKPGGTEYNKLGFMQYWMGMMQEAFDSYGQSLEYVKTLSCYIFRARILCRYSQYDQAQEILDYLAENDIDTDGVRFCRSLILEGRDEKEEEAEQIRKEIIANYEKGGEESAYAELIWEVYHASANYLFRHDADPKDILDMIERGLKTRSDYSPLLMNKAYVLDERLNEHEQGLEWYKKVYDWYPRHTSVCDRIAAIYLYDLHDVETAIQYYTEQKERNDNPFNEAQLGYCYSLLNDYETSERHCKTALEMDSTHERALVNYIWMLERSKQYERALEVATQWSELAGDDSPQPWRHLAQINARMGRYAEAADLHLKAYEKFSATYDIKNAADMLQHGGLNERYLNLLEQYKTSLGDDYYDQLSSYYKAAGDNRKWLRAIRAMSETNSSRARYLADYYYEQGDYQKALDWINSYFLAEPDSIMSRYLPIKCKKHLGQTDGIEELFERGLKVLERDNTPWLSPLYLTKKAYLLLAMGRIEEAKQCVDAALASPLCEQCDFTLCIDGYDALAEYYETTGDYNRAVETCLEALKSVPNDPDCSARIQRIRRNHKKELSKENRK